MIDFIKILVYDSRLIDSVWNNPILTYHSEKHKLNRATGVINSKETKQYKNLLFARSANALEITGSLHYYFNNGEHNANDFYVTDAIIIVNELKQLFSLDLSQCYIVNLEFGINLYMPIDAKTFINGFLYSERNRFINDNDLPYSLKAGSIDSSGKHNHYKTIKAYIKGMQFPKYCDPNTFRFEIKSKQSKYIKNLGVKTLSDLLYLPTYQIFGNTLINEWNNILLIDLNIDPVKEKERKYWNDMFWRKQLLDNNRNKFSYHKKNFKSLLEKKYPKNIYHSALEIIKQKIDAISTPTKTNQILKNDADSTPIIKTKNDADSIIYINGNCTNSNKQCPVTGLNISMQQKRSFLLSHTGLKYYFKNDRKTFEEVKLIYLTSIHRNKDHKTQIMEIAHNIRNTWKNRKESKRRYFEEHQNQLHLFG